jgi:hypothetical protein
MHLTSPRWPEYQWFDLSPGEPLSLSVS